MKLFNVVKDSNVSNNCVNDPEYKDIDSETYEKMKIQANKLLMEVERLSLKIDFKKDLKESEIMDYQGFLSSAAAVMYEYPSASSYHRFKKNLEIIQVLKSIVDRKDKKDEKDIIINKELGDEKDKKNEKDIIINKELAVKEYEENLDKWNTYFNTINWKNEKSGDEGGKI
jgi:hypothetical protein